MYLASERDLQGVPTVFWHNTSVS